MPLLEVEGLVKYYGRRKVVDGVSFEVEPGEIVGLLGPNGAGKTTSFRMTTGQISPFAGRVTFNGNDVTSLPMYKRARLGMGYLPQETSVFRKLTVEQNILAILEIIPRSRSLKRKLTRKERHQRTDAVLEQFGLTNVRKNLASRLSGGEKRRLEIARCLVCEPLLILLDEPFTGIDPPTIADIQSIARDLRDMGIGILVTDHRAREIIEVTDRVYIIKAGEVRTHGTPEEIIRDPVAINEYLGTSFLESPFAPVALAARRQAEPEPKREVVSAVVEHELRHHWIEKLKSPEHAHAAMELMSRGTEVVPDLLDAIERGDTELRIRACEIVRQLVPGARLDPNAPEPQRRQELDELRARFHRKAG